MLLQVTSQKQYEEEQAAAIQRAGIQTAEERKVDISCDAALLLSQIEAAAEDSPARMQLLRLLEPSLCRLLHTLSVADSDSD
eukprot:SAG31_NODE_43632_length_266_cov_0.622754_1_plen_81_part_10